jgi:Fic family protein
MHVSNPPFTITSKIIFLVGQISECVGNIFITPKLCKENFIKTITGTLEIEGNTLGEEKITAILEGKKVLGSVREIAEVHGAIKVYEDLSQWNYSKEKDLLKAHGILMGEILIHAGKYRLSQVGISGKDGVTHIAPPSERVPLLMSDLFGWLKSTKEHPLIVSSVFHYEFEFIHPFSDGNGRMGRLWQTLILYQWKPLFAMIPIESVVREKQQAYYKALEDSGVEGESTLFVEFMLESILEACQNIFESNQKILELMANNPKITIAGLMQELNLSESGIKKIIAKLKTENKLKRTGSLKGGEWEVIK